MSNLQNHYHFKLDFQKVDQYTGDNWLIHDTKCHKGNQLQTPLLNIVIGNVNMTQGIRR